MPYAIPFSLQQREPGSNVTTSTLLQGDTQQVLCQQSVLHCEILFKAGEVVAVKHDRRRGKWGFFLALLLKDLLVEDRTANELQVAPLQSRSLRSMEHSTWLKSAADASFTYGMLESLMKLNDTSETRGLTSEEAGRVLSSWSSGNRTFGVTSGFGLAYAAGGKAPALSFVLSLLTVLCLTGH